MLFISAKQTDEEHQFKQADDVVVTLYKWFPWRSKCQSIVQTSWHR